VSLDALRISSALHPSQGPLIKHMVSVEAAVWEETFWPVIEKTYLTHTYTVDDLKRGSWSFWFNQVESPVSEAAERLINSYSPKDKALRAMRVGDAISFLGLAGGRLHRGIFRNESQHYRVPIGDDMDVNDADNMPDLAFEIPALTGGDLLVTFPKVEDLTNPLGTVANPLEGSISIGARDLGWSERGHSDFLSGSLYETWKWYEALMEIRPTMENESVLPKGEE